MKQVIIESIPDVSNFIKQGFVCVDMHVHSLHSDGCASIDAISKRAKELSIGVALSDHNTSSGSVALAKKRVFCVPAVEVNSFDGPHALVYFYKLPDCISFCNNHVHKYLRIDKHGRTNMRFKNILDCAQSYKCLVAVAHPCGLCWTNVKHSFHSIPESVLDKLDLVEVFNGEQFMSRNYGSQLLAKNMQKPGIGGSDAHCLFELGSVLTCAKADSIKGFLDKVKTGNSVIVGKRFPFYTYSIPGLCSMRNHWKNDGLAIGTTLKHLFK